MEQLTTQTKEAALSLQLDKLPDIETAPVAPVDILGEYWSPTEIGESKRVYFLGFSSQISIDRQTGEDVELNIVQFLERGPNDFHTIRNASSRLYGTFEQMARDLKSGQPFLITYLGKKKTATGNLMDNWKVQPIIIGESK